LLQGNLQSFIRDKIICCSIACLNRLCNEVNHVFFTVWMTILSGD
jgi:hypothetical protein